jgi:hypothetical protein
MDFPAVRATLLDLPSTFTRQQAWFTQLMDSLAYEVAIETTGSDDIAAQAIAFTNAIDGWIDIWGLLFGIPRNPGEGNAPYSSRIQATILALVGTAPAIQIWLNLFAPGGTVATNPGGLGYSITFPAAMTTAQIVAFLVSLNRIRPDGVPFMATQGGGALYLGTIDYLGKGNVLGDYISGGASPAAQELAAVTLSAAPLIPSLYLSDPILNPSLAPTAALP